jgi:hypothetical protein
MLRQGVGIGIGRRSLLLPWGRRPLLMPWGRRPLLLLGRRSLLLLGRRPLLGLGRRPLLGLGRRSLLLLGRRPLLLLGRRPLLGLGRRPLLGLMRWRRRWWRRGRPVPVARGRRPVGTRRILAGDPSTQGNQHYYQDDGQRLLHSLHLDSRTSAALQPGRQTSTTDTGALLQRRAGRHREHPRDRQRHWPVLSP